jgi:hypothetical protein
MRKSGKYVQAHNAQAAVDSTAQVIVAQSLSNNATDGAAELSPRHRRLQSEVLYEWIEILVAVKQC